MSTIPFADRVREVLDLALERPPQEREAFISGLCGQDERLRAEVLSLLRALETGGDALEPPAAQPPPAAAPLTGLRFGPYHVAERVGEGGMGVVYRAEDTRLGRTVAVKALPASVARDPHRRARFEHEARVLASLNHPNIAGIYGVEDTARGPVMVLEFVPGDSLARRLGKGPLPVDDAVAVAIQVARGLEAAHAAGVVHRDLKPANIQLSEGGVKILDFGIAKQAIAPLAPASGDDAPTLTVPGGIVGTAGYMSPEQARGRPVDRRTDLWAFGCVLFEMLSGRRAFDGDTTSDTVAAVLRADPDWPRLPAETPPAVLRLLRRCLEKDPDRRQRDAGDARLELESADAPQGPDGSTPRRRLSRRSIAWAALGAAAIVLAYVAGSRPGRERPAPGGPGAPGVRFAIDLPAAEPLSVAMGGNMAPAPDGRSLVYSAGPPDRPRLYQRRLDSLEGVPLPGTEGATTPFFSPDGRRIGFVVDSQLKRIALAGGAPEVIVPAGVSEYGCSWGPDDMIVFVANAGFGLQRVPAAGGEVEPLAPSNSVKAPYAHAHPDVLPTGDVILHTVASLEGDRYEARVEALVAERTPGAPAGGSRPAIFRERRMLVSAAACPRFVPPDRLFFWQAGSLMVAPFDPSSVRLTGDASVVTKPLAGGEVLPMPRYVISGGSARATRAGSAAGVEGPGVPLLAWLPGTMTYDLTSLAWFDQGGSATVVTEGGPAIDGPRLSPDGTRVAVLIGISSGNVWVHDLTRGTRLVLTTGEYRGHALWTPDGKRVVCVNSQPSQPRRVEWMPADGSGTAETLLETPEGRLTYPTDATLDGRSLLLTHQDTASGPIDVFLFDLETRAAPRRLLPPGPPRYGARISTDGTMIAYTSEETGDTEVYLHRFPTLGSKIRVSTDGGYRPVWSRDGRQLFFRYLNRLSVVDVGAAPPDPGSAAPTAGPGSGPISVSRPRVLFEHLPDARYEVSADGKRFLMARPSGDWGPQTRINVMIGWDPSAALRPGG